MVTLFPKKNIRRPVGIEIEIENELGQMVRKEQKKKFIFDCDIEEEAAATPPQNEANGQEQQQEQQPAEQPTINGLQQPVNGA